MLGLSGLFTRRDDVVHTLGRVTAVNGLLSFYPRTSLWEGEKSYLCVLKEALI